MIFYNVHNTADLLMKMEHSLHTTQFMVSSQQVKLMGCQYFLSKQVSHCLKHTSIDNTYNTHHKWKIMSKSQHKNRKTSDERTPVGCVNIIYRYTHKCTVMRGHLSYSDTFGCPFIIGFTVLTNTSGSHSTDSNPLRGMLIINFNSLSPALAWPSLA